MHGVAAAALMWIAPFFPRYRQGNSTGPDDGRSGFGGTTPRRFWAALEPTEALIGSVESAVLMPVLVAPLKNESIFLVFEPLRWELCSSSDEEEEEEEVSGWITSSTSESVAPSGRVLISRGLAE